MNRKFNPSALAGSSLSIGLIVGLIIGIVLTIGAHLLFFTESDSAGNTAQEKKPLYWVAPMDPNYRRDQPGKSPMGMDLIPVYPEDSQGDSPGTVKISPDIVNNLGVRTAVAERKPLQPEIKTVGYVRYDEDQLVHIHPRVEGWIDKLYVKAEGDPVEKGEPLYEVYSPTLVNAQEELVLSLGRNNNRLVQASEERLRALQLADSTIAQLKKDKRVRQTVTFHAPQSGVVDNLNVREGFFVQPGINLMSIGALDEVWVEAEVFERQAGMVKENAPVTMTLDYLPGTTWQGTVDYIYPTLDEKTRTVKVRIRFDNPDRKLKPNMFAQVVIHSESDGETLLIPREALIRSGGSDRVVLALGNGRFKSIEVKAGRSDDTHVEILQGLNEGDEVVSSAQFLLDSESSKTSDFARMDHSGAKEQEKSVWVEATINELNQHDRRANISHGAIKQWDMMAMTMNFKIADSVDISTLKTDVTLHLEITRDNKNQLAVTGVHIPPSSESEDSRQHSPDHQH